MIYYKDQKNDFGFAVSLITTRHNLVFESA